MAVDESGPLESMADDGDARGPLVELGAEEGQAEEDVVIRVQCAVFN